ncbi:double-stranded RNA-specific editase 1-like [Hydractinia symbiolongicarpus]|uniref:double-stranded RNA-specific editase 1-like n=1 Tax=Hydractinia symbiolongicarpus TaxID=13093 RepID=UPI00254CDBF2|nr:double-stranded RNA-specific editase 1-like [Hydractinia symbiolongicarpus]
MLTAKYNGGEQNNESLVGDSQIFVNRQRAKSESKLIKKKPCFYFKLLSLILLRDGILYGNLIVACPLGSLKPERPAGFFAPVLKTWYPSCDRTSYKSNASEVIYTTSKFLNCMQRRMGWPHSNKKRKDFEEKMAEDGPASKKSKKHPVMELNERFPSIEYLFVQAGPVHEPTFKAYTILNEKSFEGSGTTKQKAKLDLATRALEELGGKEEVIKTEREESEYFFEHYQPLNHTLYQSTSGVEGKYIDFTSDEEMPSHDRDRPLYAPPSVRSPTHPPPDNPFRRPGALLPHQAVGRGFPELFTNPPAINIEKARCYPVMVLSEIFPNMRLNWCEGSGQGDRQFKVEADVQSKRFFGEGRSKKTAKLNLAKTILLCIYDIHDFKDAEITKKSPKVKPEEIQLEKKFPLTQLKELLREDLNIEVIQEEAEPDSEEKSYHATIVIKGVAYEGVGKNRNLAKLRAAKKALDVIRPKKDGMAAYEDAESSTKVKTIDTSRHPTMVFYELFRDIKLDESEEKTALGITEYHIKTQIEGKVFKAKGSSKKRAKLRLALSVLEELKNIDVNEWTAIDLKDIFENKSTSNPATNHPIVLLLKLNPQTRFEVWEDCECNASVKFKATAYVGERDFIGEGPNKKTAKTVAAREALNTLYGINPDIYTEGVKGETQCKVIAAFVLAKCEDTNSTPDLQVVSIGTGTKCVTGDQMDHKGQTLNDCHGEIIACRGFRRYLYNELFLAAGNKSSTIFARQPNGKFALKPSVHVYLFVNTAPCGDGRVFTLQTHQQGAKNKTAGLLRTKIENGQGTIPVPENNIQTSDGILEGERLRTMSCSDKILKWNALGVQGALLSYFTEPIYLQGIVVGLHYHYEALYRALYKRAGRMKDCPEAYALNKPCLGTPTNADINRDTSKANSNSFNWYSEQKNVEAVNATTGKTVVQSPSRLCKLNFYDQFMQLIKAFRLKLNPKTYHAAKVLACDHQKAKENFFKALNDTTCGKWIGKPYEHDMFGY